MQNIIAEFFRLIFKISFFKRKYYFFNQHIFFRFQIFKGLNKKILYKKKFYLNLDLNDWIQQQIFFLGDYEKQEIDFLRNFLKKGDVFIDVGGNIGLFSLNASDVIGETGKVYTFEPFKPNFLQIFNNLQINHIQNVTLEQIAITKESGILPIFYNEELNNLGMASLHLQEYSIAENVKSDSLDNYFSGKELKKINLVKIDVEGEEYNVILGMKEMLLRHKPAIIIEINTATLKNSNKTELDLLNLFDELKYQKTEVISYNQNSYNAVFKYIP